MVLNTGSRASDRRLTSTRTASDREEKVYDTLELARGEEECIMNLATLSQSVKVSIEVNKNMSG